MASAEGWVFRVAFNLAASHWRRRRAERRAYDRLDIVAASVTDSTERIALWDVLRSLPPRQRAAIVLRYYSGLSVSETALALDCAQGTVKSLTSQGLSGLRTVMAVELPVDAMEVAPDA